MIIIDVDDRAVMEALRQLRSKLGDMTPAMNSIGMELEARVSRRFEDESDPSGRLWAPWKPATRKSYPKDGNAHILDRTGDMLDSLSATPRSTSTEPRRWRDAECCSPTRRPAPSERKISALFLTSFPDIFRSDLLFPLRKVIFSALP